MKLRVCAGIDISNTPISVAVLKQPGDNNYFIELGDWLTEEEARQEQGRNLVGWQLVGWEKVYLHGEVAPILRALLDVDQTSISDLLQAMLEIGKKIAEGQR